MWNFRKSTNKALLAFMLTAGCIFASSLALASTTIDVTTSPSGSVYGNSSNPDGSLNDLSPVDNTVNLHAGVSSSYDTYGAAVYSPNTTYYSVTGNTVNIASGASATSVAGGYLSNVTGAVAQTGTVSDNHVVNNGGTLRASYGGYAFINISDTKATGIISGNTVTHNSGSVTGDVGGGIALLAQVDLTTPTNHASVTGNHVFINGTTTIGGNVYGGRIDVYTATANTHPGAAIANDNSVTIAGTPDLSASTLYGGRIFMATESVEYAGATYSGNTLNMKTSGVEVKGLHNFQNYNFYLNDTVLADVRGGGSFLKVTDSAKLGTGIVVKVVGTSGMVGAVQTGETMTLIDLSDAATVHAFTFDSDTFEGDGGLSDGLTLEQTLTYSVDAKGNIIATVGDGNGGNGGKVKGEGESLTAGAAAAIATLIRGGDLAAGSGIGNLLGTFSAYDQFTSSNSANASPAYCGGWSAPVVFAAVEGGKFKYDTRYDVDVKGVSYLTGFGWRNIGANGALVVGAFFEGGYSDFDSDGWFGDTFIRSDGDNRYYGGGLLARYDWTNGLYAEASFRAGVSKTKYDNDLVAANGRINYKLSSAYFGAHAGLGYKWSPSACSVLDMSVKYLWTRQNSDSALVNGGRFDFDAADSHRVRVGARYSYNTSSGVSPYAGVSFEYEFSAKSRTRAVETMVNYGAPTMKGGTGVGELGVTYGNGKGFHADLGVQGHVGKRSGVTGSLKLGMAF